MLSGVFSIMTLSKREQMSRIRAAISLIFDSEEMLWGQHWNRTHYPDAVAAQWQIFWHTAVSCIIAGTVVYSHRVNGKCSVPALGLRLWFLLSRVYANLIIVVDLMNVKGWFSIVLYWWTITITILIVCWMTEPYSINCYLSKGTLQWGNTIQLLKTEN